MQELTPIQVRVLGCMLEKEKTTPDQYPLTLNSLRSACNQKTSRSPVTDYTEGEIGHALRELEALRLVREEWGARTPKYSQRLGEALCVYSKGMALLATLMLRGPQTLGELKTHSHRMFDFDDLDDVQFALQKLIEADPPLVMAFERQPGQKEGRYAHLLAGEPEAPPVTARASAPASAALEARVKALEDTVIELQSRLDALEG
ncbi:DUF480 domain-containing protein [Marinihelvus fidelis]|uniref:DUF480 domain-containing protein n=1 Tax=Marinihelvus fidelis TaxID=2613842 RepID=A0A5N0T5G8_9GAMM|nr:YceH family protein [Marinihelvus fidelis]KAA9130183.1 DUF480 domain-containing protein [Marinihelvus fidelis]